MDLHGMEFHDMTGYVRVAWTGVLCVVLLYDIPWRVFLSFN